MKITKVSINFMKKFVIITYNVRIYRNQIILFNKILKIESNK